MSDTVMLEAALFQLRGAAQEVNAFYAAQLELALSVVAQAIAAARDGATAANVNDLAFAVNDLAAIVDELNADDAERMAKPLAMLRADVDELRAATSLPPHVIAAARALQQKLRERHAAMERAQFRPADAPETPMPHPTEGLREEALPLHGALHAAGFETPSLDVLVDATTSLRYHTMGEIIDELDVILG